MEVNRQNKLVEIVNIVAFILIIVICVYGSAKQIVSDGIDLFGLKDSDVDQVIRENFAYSEQFSNIKGIIYRLAGKDILGNFDYIKDERGSVKVVGGKVDEEAFVDSMASINKVCKGRNIPFLYVSIPDSNEYIHGNIRVNGGKLDNIADMLSKSGVDVLNVKELPDEELRDNTAAFYSDIHYRTIAEFDIAHGIVDYLEKKYGVEFSDYEQSFALSNYEIRSFPFIGNTVREVGKFYTKTDEFEIYYPLYETDLGLWVPGNNVCRRGSFEQVLLNGYEYGKYDEYTYWVTDFGQFPNEYYYINNYNNEDSADLLVICDSLFMRGFSYISLCADRVTVYDPRYNSESDILSQLIEHGNYDAVVSIGISDNFYNDCRTHKVLDVDNMITEDEYGQWIGRNGICVDTVNNVDVGNGDIIVDLNNEIIDISGWAADFKRKCSYKELYLCVGDNTLRCSYGMASQGMVDHFGIEDMRNSLFNVSFPSDWLSSRDIHTIYFVGTSGEGECEYTPVEYQVVYR